MATTEPTDPREPSPRGPERRQEIRRTDERNLHYAGLVLAAAALVAADHLRMVAAAGEELPEPLDALVRASDTWGQAEAEHHAAEQARR